MLSRQFPDKKFLFDVWQGSSVGKSAGLISPRSAVRSRPLLPFLNGKMQKKVIFLKNLPKSLKNQFETWLGFLLRIREVPKNKELLTEYLFGQFSYEPKNFESFLAYIHLLLKSDKRQQLAKIYLDILSPLCERFGVFNEKEILDDLCFNIVFPENYRSLSIKLNKYQEKAGNLIRNITKNLENLLRHEKYSFVIKGRYKSLYSIYRKLNKKFKNDIFKLRDIFAFRIILKSRLSEQCFEVLDLLHDQFEPIVDGFKDYISIPKVNGYQSLHTALNKVISGLDLPIEVQIRTQVMDDFAEKGMAAHFLYAETKKSKLVSEKEKLLLKHLSENTENPDEQKTIYCFSPAGDLFKLEKGATPLEFAYTVHTDFGNKFKSAIVNNETVGINYYLKNGDQVKIVKAETNQVREDWLKYIHNKNIRKKIYEQIKQ